MRQCCSRRVPLAITPVLLPLLYVSKSLLRILCLLAEKSNVLFSSIRYDKGGIISHRHSSWVFQIAITMTDGMSNVLIPVSVSRWESSLQINAICELLFHPSAKSQGRERPNFAIIYVAHTIPCAV